MHAGTAREGQEGCTGGGEAPESKGGWAAMAAPAAQAAPQRCGAARQAQLRRGRNGGLAHAGLMGAKQHGTACAAPTPAEMVAPNRLASYSTG